MEVGDPRTRAIRQARKQLTHAGSFWQTGITLLSKGTEKVKERKCKKKEIDSWSDELESTERRFIIWQRVT